MREVNNNLDMGKIQQPAVPAKTDAGKTEPQIPQQGESQPVVKDFSNPKAEFLGRSQVQATNALEKDVAFGMKNQETIAKADKMFDMAYNNAIAQGMSGEDAYKQAAGIMNAYVEEFA